MAKNRAGRPWDEEDILQHSKELSEVEDSSQVVAVGDGSAKGRWAVEQ